jgi:hypothetical protein
VLDVPQQQKPVGIRTVNDCKQPFQPIFTPAPEVEPVERKVRFDPEMEIGNHKIPFFPGNDQRRAVANKFQVHSGFKNPFWGW